MSEETASDIVLTCINALELLPENTSAIKHLSDGRVYSCIVKHLTNADIRCDDTDKLFTALDSLLKEHFAGPKLVKFEDVASGRESELVKLTLLLLYILFLTCTKLNTKLIQSPLMTESTQLKVKYLIESIQKRGSGMSEKFLSILCQDKIGTKNTVRCHTPVACASWGSPLAFSNSPKTSSAHSPLRELALSPLFRLQKLLNGKSQEMKHLQQQIHSIDYEKQELVTSYESSQNKIFKLSDQLAKCQQDLKDQQNQRDELEAQILSGEDLVQKEMHRLSRELAAIRKEKSSLEDTVHHLTDENDELKTKTGFLHTRLTVTSAERNRLEEELSTMIRAKTENESIIDEQAVQIRTFRVQLEELQDCLLENNKTTNQTIEESFECDSPVNFSPILPPQQESEVANMSGENMAEVVVDKLLVETQEELAACKEQYSLLMQEQNVLKRQFEETDLLKDQLQEQVKSLTNTLGSLQTECESVRCERKAIMEELANTREDFDSVNKERNNLLRDLDMKTAEYISLQQQIDRDVEVFIQEKTNMMENIEAIQKQNEQQKREMQEHLTNFNSESVKLKEDILLFKKEKDELQKSLSLLENENKIKISKIETERDNIAAENKLNLDHISSLHEEVQKMKLKHVEECNQLRFELYEIKNVESSLQEKLVDMEKEHLSEKENLLIKLKSHQEKVYCLEQEITEKTQTYEEEKKYLNDILEMMEKKHNLSSEEKDSKIETLEKERSTLQESLKTKGESLCALIIENEENAADFATREENMSRDLEEKCKDIEQLQMQIQQSRDTAEKERAKLTMQIEAKETLLQNLKLEHDTVHGNILKEKFVLEESLTEKEKIISSLQEDIKRVNENLCCEKDFGSKLLQNIAENEEKYIKENQKSKELFDGQKQEMEVEWMEKLRIVENEKSELENNMREIQRQHDTTVQELNDKVQKFTLEIAEHCDKNEELSTEMKHLRKDMSSGIAEREKFLADIRREMSEKISCLSNSISEKELLLNKIEQQKEEIMQQYSDEIKKNEENKNIIVTLQNDSLQFKESESVLSKELKDIKIALEALQKEIEIKDKKCQGLSAALANMTRNAADIETEFVSKKEELEQRIAELSHKVQELHSDLKKKDETYKQKLEAVSKEVAVCGCNEVKLLETQLKSNEEILQKKHTELETLAFKADEEKAKLAETLQVNEESCKNLEIAVTSLKEEKTKLAEALQVNEESCKNMEMAVTSLKEEKAKLAEALQVKEESYKNLEIAVTSLKEDTHKNTEKYERMISNLEKEKEVSLERLQVENDHLKEVLQVKEKTLTLIQEKLQENNDSLRTEKDSLLQNLLASQKELASLQKEHDISKESLTSEVTKLKEEVLDKIRQITSLQKDVEREREESRLVYKELYLKHEKMTSEHKSCQTEIDELNKKVNELQKSLISKKEEFELELSTALEEHKTAISDLKSCLSEENSAYEILQKEFSEKTEKYISEISTLTTAIDSEKWCVELLQKEKRDLEKDQDLSSQKIQSLSDEVTSFKSQLKYLEELVSKKENALDEGQLQLREDLEKARKLENEKDTIISGLKDEVTRLTERLQAMEGDASAKDQIYLTNMEDLRNALKATKKLKAQVHSVEAKMIDLAKEASSAKEETMRTEREMEKSSRSLAEELQATKEKYRAERDAVVANVKLSYKTEIEKLLIQIDEKAQAENNCQIYKQKYEAAKKKLSETLNELKEVKTSREHYQTQVSKYKEHSSRISENLKKEQVKNAELSELHLPLKEKLKEAEQSIKRLDNEKRTLEAQVKLADAQVRDMRRQLESDNVTGAPKTRLRPRESISDTQLVKVTVSRHSTSSTEEDMSGNDSTQHLLNSKSRGRPKAISRAVSSDAVFRKPEVQSLTNDSHQRSVTVANLAAAASSRTRKETGTHNGKSTSDKSLGRSVPRDMLFSCEDEEELFSNKYLLDMQVGRCNPMGDDQWKRLSELQRRNSLYPPHMRSAYPAEMQFTPLEDFEDDKLRDGCAVEERHFYNLTAATENLALDSPAYNLRKRKSFSDSAGSEVSLDSVGSRKSKRLSISYSRPGPPTPAKKNINKYDKENVFDSNTSVALTSIKDKKVGGKTKDSPSSVQSRKSLRNHSTNISNSPLSTQSSSRGNPSKFKRATFSPGGASFLSKKGLNNSPHTKKGMTPSSIRKILSRGKSPWKKLENEQEVSRKRTQPEQLVSRINRTLRANTK
ncbi:hypothetical protein SK128_019415 [Halocaridina rubra]|uniref:Uncharacterized protein n=1 Tax=Halocaridina rubra TaxID=373956 RepID=A0AAN9A5A8_HALRR